MNAPEKNALDLSADDLTLEFRFKQLAARIEVALWEFEAATGVAAVATLSRTKGDSRVLVSICDAID